MQKNKALKGLLAVSAAAALFASLAVQAQTERAAAVFGQMLQ